MRSATWVLCRGRRLSGGRSSLSQRNRSGRALRYALLRGRVRRRRQCRAGPARRRVYLGIAPDSVVISFPDVSVGIPDYADPEPPPVPAPEPIDEPSPTEAPSPPPDPTASTVPESTAEPFPTEEPAATEPPPEPIPTEPPVEPTAAPPPEESPPPAPSEDPAAAAADTPAEG
jgi:hypothetical protein